MHNFRTSTPFQKKSSHHFKGLHKLKLLTNFDFNLTSILGGVIVVVRQQFVMVINCSIFLYRNSFGANQRLVRDLEVLQNCAGFILAV